MLVERINAVNAWINHTANWFVSLVIRKIPCQDDARHTHTHAHCKHEWFHFKDKNNRRFPSFSCSAARLSLTLSCICIYYKGNGIRSAFHVHIDIEFDFQMEDSNWKKLISIQNTENLNKRQWHRKNVNHSNNKKWHMLLKTNGIERHNWLMFTLNFHLCSIWSRIEVTRKGVVWP